MTTSYTYTTLDGTSATSTIEEALESASKMQARFTALDHKYRERSDLLFALQLAQATGENLLLIGPPGSGKSALLREVQNIEGARSWAMDMTAYTTETNLFGAYDPRELESSGRMWHMTEGTLSEANFAHIGEVFDANDGTLRSLLGALNEKHRQNGSQHIRIPLVSAVADTNFRPEDMPGRARVLHALVDRFLFKVEVDYIKNPQVDFEVHLSHLEGRFHDPLPPLHHSVVERVMGLVTGSNPNILSDRYVLTAFLEVKNEVNRMRKEAGRAPVSTRRSVKALQTIEAFAVMQGRTTATFNDLWSVLPVLTSSLEDGPLIHAAIEESVTVWVAKEARHEVEIELKKLQSVAKFPENVELDSMSVNEVFAMVEVVNAVIDDLEAQAPKTLEGKNYVRTAISGAVLAKHEGYRAALVKAQRMLPLELHTPPREALSSLQSEVRAVGQVVKRIPRDPAYMTEHVHLSSRVDMAQEILLRRFADEEVDDLLEQWGSV